MTRREIIGIVGGMGPAAGIDLFEKILRATNARSDDEHLPVVMMSYPREIPDRTTFLLEGTGPNPADSIYTIIRNLESAGASAVGIPCNTAHAPPILDVVKEQLANVGSGIRLISMIAETVTHVAGVLPPGGQIGVLSTQAVRDLRIYAQPLSEAGFGIIRPSSEVQERLVTPAIFSRRFGLKAVNPPTDRARQSVLEALQHVTDQGAEAVILGCTELPLAVPITEYRGRPLVDPTLLLALALIRATYPEMLAN